MAAKAIVVAATAAAAVTAAAEVGRRLWRRKAPTQTDPPPIDEDWVHCERPVAQTSDGPATPGPAATGNVNAVHRRREQLTGKFADLEDYRLDGVRMTDKIFGEGSYAQVLGLQYKGQQCAGKKVHRILYEQGEGNMVDRFKAECRLLAQMEHPNIVRFIGLHVEQGSSVPILVMEYLPSTLDYCIKNDILYTEELKFSVLHGIALGLQYLHSRTPPVVHRDLSANNVLLTDDMTAKISDLGVARILNLTLQQVSHLTRVPGTLMYMPPEAMEMNPSYDTTFDIFSYGVVMIHVFSGEWPVPCEQVRVDPTNRAQLLPLSEAERRSSYLEKISHAHPLMDLILRCISNDAYQRPKIADIIEQVKHKPNRSKSKLTNRFSNSFEMHRGLLALGILVSVLCFAVIYALMF